METPDLKNSVQDEQFSSAGFENSSGTSETSAVDDNNIPVSETFEVIELQSVPEIEDDEEINIDPHNIEEEPATTETENKIEDYSEYSKSELIELLINLLSTKDVEKVKTSIEIIKVNFYKKHKAELEKIRKEAEESGISELITQNDPLEEKFKELLKNYRVLRSEFNQIVESEKQKNLQEKNRIIEEIKELVNRKESINDTFHQFRELQSQWRSIGVVPQQNIKDLWENYHHYVEIFYDFIKINKDLRDLDLKKNLEVKIDLCEKAEELLLEPSVVKAFKTLQKLHEQWREVGPVSQEMKSDIWERFKNITSKINKKHQDYFETLKDTQNKNLESKIALCERAEQICNQNFASVKEWEQSYQEMLELQKLWRTIGFAPKKDNNKIYNRFRNTCDTYFSHKRDFFAQNKEDQNNNLQLKTDLCIQAESLKDSNEWKSTTEDLIKLQKKWKEIGPVPRKQSDIVWKRFRTACDNFFKNKALYFSSIESQYEENFKLKNELINEIDSFTSGSKTVEDFQILKDFQRRWSEIGFVPLKVKDEVQKKYREAINRQFDNLKIDEGQKNLLKFKNKIENISTKGKSDNQLFHERDKYLYKLKQIENDIILWENNIGFFAKSKNAESMIAEVERKILAGKDEIKSLEEKIRMIESSINE